MADLDLDTLQRLCDAAAPGPWTLHDVNEGTGTPPAWHIANDAYHNPSDDGADAFGTFLDFGYREDAEFIAAARTAMPELIAEVRRLQAVADAAKALRAADALPRGHDADAVAYHALQALGAVVDALGEADRG